MEEEFYAVPFSLVGFLFTTKPVEESIRGELSPKELERLQDIISIFLFAEGSKVSIYPSLVPPEQAEKALKELEDMIFEDEDEEEEGSLY